MTIQKRMGKHYIVEYLDCDPDRIGTLDAVRPLLVDAVETCGATALNYAYHQFEPWGVSATVLLAESHFCLHSWPEDRYMALDIFTCGDTMDPDVAVEILRNGFAAGKVNLDVLDRGIP
jgi:S-adenosylmethionine decarboxylase proenzyme